MNYKPIISQFIFWAFFILLLSSCGKQEDNFEGKATAIKNDSSWNAECISGYSNQYPDELYITMRTYSKEGFLRENLHIGRIIPSVGLYVVVPRIADSNNISLNNNYSGFATIIDDGDVLDKFYNALNSDDNFINIKSINYDNMTISGTFNIAFVLSDTTSTPDTIRFVDGEFQSQINEN